VDRPIAVIDALVHLVGAFRQCSRRKAATRYGRAATFRSNFRSPSLPFGSEYDRGGPCRPCANRALTDSGDSQSSLVEPQAKREARTRASKGGFFLVSLVHNDRPGRRRTVRRHHKPRVLPIRRTRRSIDIASYGRCLIFSKWVANRSGSADLLVFPLTLTTPRNQRASHPDLRWRTLAPCVSPHWHGTRSLVRRLTTSDLTQSP